jgi:hypothetical protein
MRCHDSFNILYNSFDIQILSGILYTRSTYKWSGILYNSFDIQILSGILYTRSTYKYNCVMCV